MADWDPAEMIGDKPRHLAVSLYKELITNDVWNDQRQQYGYQNVYPNVLMFTFAGSPYIDLRTDINSFIPNGWKRSRNFNWKIPKKNRTKSATTHKSSLN